MKRGIFPLEEIEKDLNGVSTSQGGIFRTFEFIILDFFGPFFFPLFVCVSEKIKKGIFFFSPHFFSLLPLSYNLRNGRDRLLQGVCVYG